MNAQTSQIIPLLFAYVKVCIILTYAMHIFHMLASLCSWIRWFILTQLQVQPTVVLTKKPI